MEAGTVGINQIEGRDGMDIFPGHFPDQPLVVIVS